MMRGGGQARGRSGGRCARQDDFRLIELALDLQQLVCLGWVLRRRARRATGRLRRGAERGGRGGGGVRAWYFCSEAAASSSPAVESAACVRHASLKCSR